MTKVIEITTIFESNFTRLNNLMFLYESLRPANAGRPNTSQLELLRATVVFAHSTLEDFIRNIQLLKLPTIENHKLKDIWLTNTKSPKFTMEDIFQHRDLKVQYLIEKSVKDYLNHQSYNKPSDVADAINSCNLEVTEDIRDLFPTINQLMLRRHHIVHRADRNENTGRGHHKYNSLNLNQVKVWINSIDQLASFLTIQL